MAEQGLCTYAGWPIIGGEMTLSRGVRPSSCLLRVLPAANLTPTVDTLIWTYGANQFGFNDAAVDATTLRIGHGRDGWRWAVKVYDRRWKWRYPTITGVYNQRDCDGKVKEGTKKNIKQLMILLLDAMGESGYQINGVPEKVYPYVSWDETPAAPELERLCDMVGCVVSLTTYNKTRIDPIGTGAQLPPGLPNVNPIFKSKPGVMPSIVRFVGGPTLKSGGTTGLELEAVGLETDDTVKLLADLSYKPTNWTGEWWNAFAGVSPTYRHLAFKSVWRWYRPVKPTDEGQTTYTLVDPIERGCLGAAVKGIFYPQCDHAINTKDGTVWAGEFRVLEARNVIEFEYPVIKWDDHLPVAADLDWFGPYSESDGSDRYTFEKPVPGSKLTTKPRILYHPEVFLTDDNEAEVQEEAAAYVDAVLKTYAADPAQDVLYEGLRDISPDGAIAQVRWICGHGRPALTRAGRNMEFDVWTPHHHTRRRHSRAVLDEHLRDRWLGEKASTS